MKSDEKQNKKIESLLTEYRACHLNRSHYSSVRWSIGSIFIVGSLTLIGFSLTITKILTLEELIGMAIVSLLSTLVWYIYNRIITQYVLLSIKRMHQIEQKLQKKNFDIRLHTSIYEFTKNNTLKGRHVAILYWGVVYGAWLIRFLLYILHNFGWNWFFILITSDLFLIGMLFVLLDILHLSPARKISIP